MPAHFSFRLTVALAFSFVLHGSLIVSDAFKRAEPSPPPSLPALRAALRLPEPALPPEPAPPELLLKNTIGTENQETPAETTQLPAPPPIQEAAPEPPAPPPRIASPTPANRPTGRSTPKTAKASASQKHAEKPQATTRSPLAAVQQKLSEFVFYPEAARSQGIEGTVHLFIELGPDCTVEDVRIDGSSGSRLLDKAAEKGAWAVHKLPGCRSGIYPYVFRLVD